MELGLPWWIGAGDPAEGIGLAARAGYDFVEISLDAPWPEGIDPIALAEEADDAGVSLGMHGPWRTQALAHPREPLAQAAREIAHDCLTAAQAAGAGYIVFHVDARGFAGYPREDVVEQGLQTAHASLQALSRSAGDDLDVLVENTTRPLGTPSELASFLEPLADVGFCLDPGHAAILAERDESAPAWDASSWSQLLSDRPSLLHAMDIAYTEDGIRDHLLPGAGEADVGHVVSEVRQAGCSRVLVEAFYADTDGTGIREEDWRAVRKRLAGA